MKFSKIVRYTKVFLFHFILILLLLLYFWLSPPTPIILFQFVKYYLGTKQNIIQLLLWYYNRRIYLTAVILFIGFCAQMIVHRHRRMMVFSTIAVVLALILTAKHENNVRFISSDMENARPRDVWEYVSDFSNVMKLNPTM